MFRSGTLTAAVMLAIFGSMTAMAFGFPEKARMMPLIFGIPGTVLALVQLVIELRKQPVALDPAAAAEEREKRGQEIRLFAWLGVFFVGILAFGFVVAAPILVFAFLRFGQGESWTVSLVGGAGAWVILWGLFGHVLELFLFEGHLLPLITG